MENEIDNMHLHQTGCCSLSAEQNSSLALAFLGDSVYELMVREYLLEKGFNKVSHLHKETVKFVNAKTQSDIIHYLEKSLSLEEAAVVKRGRNAKSRIPKNVEMIDYHFSTAFECLIGYLYLKKNFARLKEIFETAKKIAETDNASVK